VLLDHPPTPPAPEPRSARHRAAGRPAGTAIRHDLQGVRAVAVLGVVIYHLKASWLPGGFAGVDVFFVLSGFFITGLLRREVERTGTVDLIAFWARRARRLLPASLLVLVVTVIAGRLMTNPLEAHRIARDGIFSTIFGMNWHEAASGLAYGQDPDPSAFQHYWSLAVEEQFYLAWPLLMLALALLWRRRPALAPRRTLPLIAVGGGVLSFTLAFHQTVGNQPYAYYGTFGRVWQLALGGLLAAGIAWSEALPLWVRSCGRVAGLGVILGFYGFGPSASEYPGWWSLLPALGAALIVVAGEPGTRPDPAARLLGTRLGQLGGRYSYSWYLWHWAPLVLLPVALDRPLRIRELGWCAIGTLLAAVLTYHLLEDPLRRNRWLAIRHGGRSLAFGGALMAVALGVSVWTSSAEQHAAEDVRIVADGYRTLAPQPADAAAEKSQLSIDGCQLPMTSTAAAPDCRYLPDSGHGDLILVGDSHAGAAFPAVQKAAQDNRWGLRAWARTSCPFADIHKAGPGGGDYVSCNRWRADVIKRLIAARPSLVIITNYASSGLHVTDPHTHKGATQKRAHELFQAGMERSLTRLRDAGLRVLLIGDVPAFTRAAPDCVLAHRDDLAACSLPQPEALPDGGSDQKAAVNVPGVRVLDLTDRFCRGARCYQVVGGLLAYRDTSHLTTAMSLSLTDDVAAAVRTALT